MGNKHHNKQFSTTYLLLPNTYFQKPSEEKEEEFNFKICTALINKKKFWLNGEEVCSTSTAEQWHSRQVL